jgi:hypothetical protein
LKKRGEAEHRSKIFLKKQGTKKRDGSEEAEKRGIKKNTPNG